MAVVPWANTNAVGETITKAWADETRSASVLYEGIVTCASTTGVTVTFAEAFSSIADYAVEIHWQEDPGADGGYLYPEKSVGSVNICNSGIETAKSLYYCVKRIVGA